MILKFVWIIQCFFKTLTYISNKKTRIRHRELMIRIPFRGAKNKGSGPGSGTLVVVWLENAQEEE
jgi:hypothetical protein